MAKKGGCLGCFFKLLIALVVILVILGAAVYFGGNWAMQTYIGTEGSVAQLGINNWGDVGRLVKVFNGNPPAIRESDKPNADNVDGAVAALEAAIGNDGLDGLTSGEKLSELVAEMLAGADFDAVLSLSGGQIAAMLQETLVQDEQIIPDIGISVQSVSIAPIIDPDDATAPINEANISICLSVSKDSLIALINERLPGLDGLWNWLLKGDFYITSTNRFAITDGVVALSEEGTNVVTINDLSESDSAILLKVMSYALGGDSIDTTITSSISTILNKLAGSNSSLSFGADDEIIFTPK
ncbi:MAG: hypothetical protein LBS99_00770 [Clostridiales bacterium]|jgi:hypothetical protein|nr:hypothetical protein [Clostridiales bacterium]